MWACRVMTAMSARTMSCVSMAEFVRGSFEIATMAMNAQWMAVIRSQAVAFIRTLQRIAPTRGTRVQRMSVSLAFARTPRAMTTRPVMTTMFAVLETSVRRGRAQAFSSRATTTMSVRQTRAIR